MRCSKDGQTGISTRSYNRQSYCILEDFVKKPPLLFILRYVHDPRVLPGLIAYVLKLERSQITDLISD
jgi:hypothetical protein